MNRLTKKTLKSLGILLGILSIMYIIVVAYVSVHKKSIIRQVTESLSKRINGNVIIGDVELSLLRTFPKVSVLLNDVTVTDTMFIQHHHAFLKAQRVVARLSILSLINKQPAINGVLVENGSAYLFTDTSGYNNNYLFRPGTDSVAASKISGNEIELKAIRLKGVRLIIDDRRMQKLHDLVFNDFDMKLDDKDTSSLIFASKANVLIHRLAFNLDAGSFLNEKVFEGKFELGYNKKSGRLQFDRIDIKLSGHPFNLSGWFDLAGLKPQFNLEIRTRGVLFSLVKTLLTEKISSALSIVDLDKKIDGEAKIKGPLKGGDPLVIVNWKVEGSHLATPFFDFDEATFTGFYINEVVPDMPRRDPNSKFTINNFSATWHGLPVFSSNIEILNLVEPTLTCDLRSTFPLTKLKELLGSNSIILESGDGVVDINYKGPIVRNNNTNSFINGRVTFKNGSILYAPRNVQMRNVNGVLAFRNSNVFVENLQCDILNNKIVMNGTAANLLSLINTEPDKATIDWNIFSPSLNLSSFTYLLKSRKTSAYKNSDKNHLQEISRKIDAVLEQGRLNVNLRAARMTYKKLAAANVVANVSLLQDKYLINNVSMEQGGGRMSLNGILSTQRSNYHYAGLNVRLDDVDVNSVFSQFNNFGQDAITAQNLSGRLSSKINASLALDDDGKVYPNSIESVVDFSLKKGTLINFEPVKKLQNFLFKNRDFENIQFAELKDRIEISNGEIRINRMEIQSSVLTVFVEGIYNTKGTTDMSVQVPLSNLKKRRSDRRPENKGADKKGGPSIYLRGRPGPDGNIEFKTDLFRKFRKQNN